MKNFYKYINTPNGILATTVVSLIIIALISEFRKTYSEKTESRFDNNSSAAGEKKTFGPARGTDGADSLDTFIPKDHVLVPIEVENISALNALIDKFSLADLYKTNPVTSPGSSDNTGELIASNIKILRAPLDPNEFAVLIHKSRAKWLMKIGFKYRVVLRNYRNTNSETVDPEFFEPYVTSNSIVASDETNKSEKSRNAVHVQRKMLENLKIEYQHN